MLVYVLRRRYFMMEGRFDRAQEMLRLVWNLIK